MEHLFFNWKGKNSFADFGLWVRKFPERKKPKERYELIEIPGRPGSVTMLEGEDIYGAYKAEMTVSCKKSIHIDRTVEWLRGSGELILSEDLSKAYEARILDEVAFNRNEKGLWVGKIPMILQPFRKAVHESQYRITMTQSSAVVNPGDVESRPLIRMTGTDPIEIACGDTDMKLWRRPAILTIDCDAEIMIATAADYSANSYYYRGDYFISNGGLYRVLTEGYGSAIEWEYAGSAPESSETFDYLWPGTWSGEFLRIPVGQSTIEMSETSSMTIDPRWRWI